MDKNKKIVKEYSLEPKLEVDNSNIGYSTKCKVLKSNVEEVKE